MISPQPPPLLKMLTKNDTNTKEMNAGIETHKIKYLHLGDGVLTSVVSASTTVNNSPSVKLIEPTIAYAFPRYYLGLTSDKYVISNGVKNPNIIP